MKRILIVDDNARVRKTMRTLLDTETGLEVCGEAIDGLDAIKKAEELRPDLIVLDLSMPVMNGIQAARILKKFIPAAPLILFTAHQDELLGAEAFDAGFSEVVSKADFGVLVRHVRSLLKLDCAVRSANRGT